MHTTETDQSEVPYAADALLNLDISPVSNLCEISAPAPIEPRSFFRSKLQSHDVILLGTKHNQPSTCSFLAELLPVLASLGVTHVGLEITSDQQHKMDKFARKGHGLGDIDIFHVIDQPEYRCFLDSIRLSGLKPVALDLPPCMYKMHFSRDEWMARNICSIFHQVPRAKVVVLVGNLHTLKKVDWLDPEKFDLFLPGHLAAYEPKLEALSVLADYDDTPHQSCKIRKMYETSKKPFVFDARGLDLTPGVLKVLAAKPMRIDELTDAVMMY